MSATGGDLDVTVVIAARDASSTISRAVASALRQGEVRQCVVVDDASDDETVAVTRGLAAADDRIEVLERPRRGGPARARDDGLAVARGRFVTFLDADDELMEGATGCLRDALLADRGAVGAVGRFRAVGPDGQDVDVGRWASDQLRPVVRRHGQMIESPGGMTPEALVSRLVVPPPGAWLFDAATLRAVGGFDPRAKRSEDLELAVRVAAAGSIAVVDRDVLRYARHGAQRSTQHRERRWGRVATLWFVLRGAPGAQDRAVLARGIAAYHLDLAATRRRSADRAVRRLAARNLVVAGAARALGALAGLLPRRVLAPIPEPDAAAEVRTVD